MRGKSVNLLILLSIVILVALTASIAKKSVSDPPIHQEPEPFPTTYPSAIPPASPPVSEEVAAPVKIITKAPETVDGEIILRGRVVMNNAKLKEGDQVLWSVGLVDSQHKIVIEQLAKGTGLEIFAKWDETIDGNPVGSPLDYTFKAQAGVHSHGLGEYCNQLKRPY